MLVPGARIELARYRYRRILSPIGHILSLAGVSRETSCFRAFWGDVRMRLERPERAVLPLVYTRFTLALRQLFHRLALCPLVQMSVTFCGLRARVPEDLADRVKAHAGLHE
jgi:hypothetical protein